jgi:predicted SnoaL-like aldol condensation-catalyzing enzyme
MEIKEMALDFLKLAGSGSVKSAYDKYISHNFIHHNQYFKGDRDSLLKAMEDASKKNPNKSIEIKNVYQDGNTVITHSLVQRKNSDEPAIAVVHIFRFVDGKVAELWDIGQVISNGSPNENGMF